jgi:hypothetical protein
MTMETLEYRLTDKSAWTPGPWSDEPDKMQFRDEATGLPCLIVRNHGGALCGYVGVDPSHPWHGKSYSDAIGECGAECSDENHYSHRIESVINVHGGLTFSDGCSDHSRERWDEWRSARPRWEAEAEQYPKGDAAQRLREWAGTFDDYEAWRARREGTGICHRPAAGEPDRVWWFGFDCAHAGDISPGYDSILGRSWPESTYKTIEYVKAQIADLAQQLQMAR